MDFDALADEYERATMRQASGNGHANGNGNGNGSVNQQPPPQPVQQQQAQQHAPAMRETPDGSLVADGYAVEWFGPQGDQNSRVVIFDDQGSSVFDGAYGELAQTMIPNVWIPAAARQQQAPQQPQPRRMTREEYGAFLGQLEQQKQDQNSRRKVVGVALGLLALTTAAGTAWAAFRRKKD